MYITKSVYSFAYRRSLQSIFLIGEKMHGKQKECGATDRSSFE